MTATVNVFTDPIVNARSGYGDYSPTTTLGKATMSGFILLFVVLLPIQINQLQSVMRMQSQFRTTYRKGFREHVVIIGNANAATVSPLQPSCKHALRSLMTAKAPKLLHRVLSS